MFNSYGLNNLKQVDDLQVGKFGGKVKGGLQQQQQASNNSSVSGLDQLNMSDKDVNVRLDFARFALCH